MQSPEQFSSVVEKYQSLVWAVAFGFTADEASAEDITQETFIVAWRRRQDVEDPDKLRPFLCGIARNLARNARRKSAFRRGALASGEATPPTPLDISLLREDERLISEAMVALEPASREALVLYYMEEQSAAEVASKLGVTPAALRQRLSRARRALRAGVENLVEQRVTGRKVAVVAGVLAAIGGGSAAGAASANGHGHGTTATVTAGKGLLIALAAAAALVVGAIGVELVFAEPGGGSAVRGAEHEHEHQTGTENPSSKPEIPSPSAEDREPSTGADTDTDTDDLKWSDQPLVTGRARSEYPEGDVDGDGQFSEDELTALRLSADDMVVDTIANNLDKDVAVTCHAISLDQATGVHEQIEHYDMAELRSQIDDMAEQGLDLSDREAIQSVVASRGGPDRLCAPLNVFPADGLRMVRMIYDTGDDDRPLLGVSVVDDGTREEGALVAGILQGTLAEKLDIRPGDVIAAVDGTEVPSAEALPEIVGRAAEDGRLMVEIERAGVRHPLEAELE